MTAHSKKIGDIGVTALSDGVLATPLDVVLGIEQAEAERLAGKRAGEPVDIAVNAFLLELNGTCALVDAGAATRSGRRSASSPTAFTPSALRRNASTPSC